MMNRNVALASALVVASWLLGAACGSSTSPSPTPAPSANVTVSIVANSGSNSFAPNPVTVTAGQTVNWKNNDSDVHQITQDANAFSTSNVSKGATTSAITMSTKGTFTYHCAIHPSMTGTITVQ